MTMFFLSLNNVHLRTERGDTRTVDRAEVEKNFKEYGIEFAWVDTLGDEHNKPGWLIGKREMYWLYNQSGQAYHGYNFHSTRTAIPDLVEYASVLMFAPKSFVRTQSLTPQMHPVLEEFRIAFPEYSAPIMYFQNNFLDVASLQADNIISFVIGPRINRGSGGQVEQKTVAWPRDAFGYSLPFTPMGYGSLIPGAKPIVERGVTVAQVLGNVIYVPFSILPDSPHITPDVEYQNIQATCTSILKEIARRALKTMVKESELNFDILKKFKTLSVQQEITNTERQIAQYRQNVKSYSDHLYTEAKRLNESIARVDVLKSGTMTFSRKEIEDALNQIKAMETVRNIRFDSTGTKLFFDTSMIYCYNSTHKTTHEIGEFGIRVDFKQTEMKKVMNWSNRTRRGANSHHAPHVDSYGFACLGNMQEMLPVVLASFDLPVIMSMAIQFVESANMSDQWGRLLDSFPVVNSKKVIVDPRTERQYRYFTESGGVLPAASLCVKENPDWEKGLPIPDGVQLDRSYEVRFEKMKVEDLKKLLTTPVEGAKPAAVAPSASTMLVVEGVDEDEDDEEMVFAPDPFV
jgi:hypothetical protein